MSASMWFWRVVLPVAGVAASLAVVGASLAPGDQARPMHHAPAHPVAPARVLAEGRVAPRPGAEVTVGTEAGGLVVRMPIGENAKACRGDLLVEFQADLKRAALDEADARLAEADAELAFARLEYERTAKAPTDSRTFTAAMDATRRDLAVAEARRREALAARTASRIELARARVPSPIDGVVTAVFVRPGETVAPGARLVTVTDLAKTWIEAEVDEFDAPRVAVGAAVTVTAEGLDAAWRGKVVEVPDRIAVRTLRPEDPGRPTDTGVLLVKIALDEPAPLKLGQQVEVVIHSAPAEAPKKP